MHPDATYEHVFVTDALGFNEKGLGEGRRFVFPIGPDGPYLINLGDAFDDPTAFVNDAYPEPGQLFIHELTHVWHLAHTSIDARTWLLRGMRDEDYDPEPGTPWGDFGIEEKAATVDRWYRAHRAEGLDSRPAFTDPYYQYIHLMRTGVTDD
jgi:hypothetical protein